MGQAKKVSSVELHTKIALCAAVRQSNKRRKDIASSVGVSNRTLQRWLKGDVAPTADQWELAMRFCGVSPAACFLAAELGRADLVGTQSYDYIDKLLHQIFSQIAGIEDAGEMPLEPRGAAHDASILVESWHSAYQRRKRFMDEEYARTGLPPFRTRT